MKSETDQQVPIDDPSMYANAYSFMGVPFSRDVASDKFDAVVMGVPYDLATTGRPGTRNGPGAIRQASSNLKWEEKRWPWQFSLPDHLKVADYGDLVMIPGDSDDMLAQVEAHASRVAQAGKTLITFGGDHFVTLPLLRAHHSW